VNFVIKVADFGLSESIDPSKDYFRQDKNDRIKLPVKWLALECLSDGIFSEKTDVVIYLHTLILLNFLMYQTLVDGWSFVLIATFV